MRNMLQWFVFLVVGCTLLSPLFAQSTAPQVIWTGAEENFYGDINQLGGKWAKVTSLPSNPMLDPREYEANATMPKPSLHPFSQSLTAVATTIGWTNYWPHLASRYSPVTETMPPKRNYQSWIFFQLGCSIKPWKGSKA